MDKIDLSASCVFIKEEMTDETEPTFSDDEKEVPYEEVFVAVPSISIKEEESPAYDDTNNLTFTGTEGTIDETESTFSVEGKEVSYKEAFVAVPMINIKEEERLQIYDASQLVEVKQEEDYDSDNGNTIGEVQEVNQFGLEEKINIDLKKRVISHRTDKKLHNCPHCDYKAKTIEVNHYNEKLKRKRELTNARVKKYRERKKAESQQLKSSKQNDRTEKMKKIHDDRTEEMKKMQDQKNAERKRAMAKEYSRRYRQRKRLSVLESVHDSQIPGPSYENPPLY
ncbi:unnamed protein product [Nezara viridula]|uniref:Uncharacterized protein n=1 Tax=Nezara viridula TaxID=85310 RepID=A0A9P0MTC0_NEZVI|nr:unnamed protein product [Nezara viridula]